MQIRTCTTEYDTNEDRIRLAVAFVDGSTRVLWLTRRLAERLVPPLFVGLEAPALDLAMAPEPAPQGQPDTPPGRPNEPGNKTGNKAGSGPNKDAAKEAAQVYAQLEARVSRKAATPVQVAADAPPLLVHEITIKKGADGTRGLVLRCPPAEPATLVMRPAEMRQWLEMLHRAFAKGGWREDIWPAWMRMHRPSKT